MLRFHPLVVGADLRGHRCPSHYSKLRLLAQLSRDKARQRMNRTAGAKATHSRLQIWSFADLALLHRLVFRQRKPLCTHLRHSQC